MIRSLQRQLAVWIGAVILLAALLGSALSYWLSFEEVADLQDDQLQEMSQLAVAPGFSRLLDDGPMRAQDDPETRIVIWKLNGWGGPPAHEDIPVPPGAADGLFTVGGGDNEWRIYVRTTSTRERIVVAQPTAARDEIVRNSGFRTLVALAIMFPMVLAVVLVVIRLLLRDLHAVAKAVDAQAGDIPAALPAQTVPLEILPFVNSINQLLGRLRVAFERERRFVTDAAHELRSPIAALNLELDNLAHVLQTDEAKNRFEPIKATMLRIRGLLDQLLALARAQTTAALPVQDIEVDRLTRGLASELLAFAESRRLDLGFDDLEPVVFAAAEDDLRAVMRNALDNAIRYSPPGGRIAISLTAEGSGFRFEVRNQAPRMTDAEMQRLFEPFFRLPGTGESGSGLGLAIARAAANRLGGQVSLARDGAGGELVCFCYRQALPAA